MNNCFAILFSVFILIKAQEDYIDITPYDYPKKNDDTFTVAILSTNDIHGSYFSSHVTTPKNKKEYDLGGLEYVAKYINILRKEWGENFLYLDGGDQFQGGFESKMTNGDIITEYFKTIGVNYTTVGNHEWDYGPEYLNSRVSAANFTYLLSNVADDTGNCELFEKQTTSKLVTIGPVKIAIIGLITLETEETSSANLTGYHFLPYENAIIKEANKYKGEANAVLLLAHVGLKCPNDGTKKFELEMRTSKTKQEECNHSDEIYKLLKKLPKGVIDVVVAAHKHDVNHHWIFDTPVMSNENNGKFASVMYLNFDKNDNYKLIKENIIIESPLPICSKVFENTKRCETPTYDQEDEYGEIKQFKFHDTIIEKDPILSDLTNKYIEEYNKSLSDILTATNEELRQQKTKEGALGNLYTDFFRFATGADIGIETSGNFRTAWQPGNISYASLFNMFPFDNELVRFEVTGKEVRRMIWEIEEGTYSYYPISGLRVVIKENSITGKRKVISVKLFDGEIERDIEDDEILSIATEDYLVPKKRGIKGGDDFGKVLKWMNIKNLKAYDDTRDMFKEYLRHLALIKSNDWLDEKNPRLRIIKTNDM